MKTWERVFVGYFGVFLIAVGLYVLVMSGAAPAWRYLGGGLLCLIGINAVYSGVTGKRSWLSRIGPLP
ncbi:MAG TPA: hypothetical protein VLC71_05020 [Thermomonas sp.]|nr:hypothetical protein [Thermomonas sp.]